MEDQEDSLLTQTEAEIARLVRRVNIAVGIDIIRDVQRGDRTD